MVQRNRGRWSEMDQSGASRWVGGAGSAGAHIVVMLAVLGLMCCTVGCGTLANGRRWGQDAFSHASPKTFSQAARDAFFDVQTLLPAVAAAVFTVGDLDERVSDWATDHTPVFGSQATAEDFSDYLYWTLQSETFATLLATPSGGDATPWWSAKAKGAGVKLLAAGVPLGTTLLLKELTNRTRPDRSDDLGFPSGHATIAFSTATLSNRNLDVIPLDPWAKYSLQVGNIMLASSVAWARIEANKHVPSDVLAGAVIGHFLSAFLHDALIGIPASQRFRLIIWPGKDEMMAYIAFPF